MRKLLLIMSVLFVFGTTIVSCTPETLNNEYQTEPDENCPPNDTNCNGIPDDKE